MDQLRNNIDGMIRALGEEYRRTPGLILTEDDLKSLLVHRLLQLPGLAEPRPTVDGVMGTQVHTEVSWFDANGKLRIKPDITILDPGGLSIFRALRKGYPLPNKGFNFQGGSIIFELKFIRNRKGVTAACVRGVQRDLEKIKALFDKIAADQGGDDLYCYFVIFSKVARRVPEFDQLVQAGAPNSRCRIVFETAGVKWPRRSAHGA